jgi:hypothetical protein
MKYFNIFTVLWILFAKDFFIFGKGSTPIQIVVPLFAPNRLHEVINSSRRNYFAEYPAGIPFDKYVAKVENDVFD